MSDNSIRIVWFVDMKQLLYTCTQKLHPRNVSEQSTTSWIFFFSLIGFNIMILSFWTDRSGWANSEDSDQSSLIRVQTVCHSVCIFLIKYFVVKHYYSNFKVITASFWGVRIFTVIWFMALKDSVSHFGPNQSSRWA